MIRAIIGSAAFTIVAPFMVAGVIPYLIAAQDPAALNASRGPLQFIGLVMFAAGAMIYLWCMAEFIRARGTPAPIDPPKEMVARGLYKVVRNPMYVGVLTAIGGQAVWFGSWVVVVYGLFVFTAVHLFVIGYEEPTLRGLFGEAYAQYCRDVPRWIPRLRPGAK